MNRGLVQNLNALFKAKSTASELNSSMFPYIDVDAFFNEKLKVYLSSLLGEEIKFDRNEAFNYIKAKYKDVPIKINTYNNIILTVEDSDREDVIQELKEVFSGLLDLDPFCRYNYCSKSGCKFIVYPTIEWDLNPERRLNDIIKGYTTIPGKNCIRDIEDYYTGSVIKSLGTDLFTYDGFKKLFNLRYDDYKIVNHKVSQIQRLNPNVDTEVIYAWLNSCRKTMDISKDRVKQKIYMDDGK